MNLIIPNGALALINPCQTVEHPNKPYAINVNGYEATIKRIKVLHNGLQLIPESTDPSYRVQFIDFGDPECELVRIIGEVVYYVLPLWWEF